MTNWILEPDHGTTLGCGPIDLLLVQTTVTSKGVSADNAAYTPPQSNESGRASVQMVSFRLAAIQYRSA